MPERFLIKGSVMKHSNKTYIRLIVNLIVKYIASTRLQKFF